MGKVKKFLWYFGAFYLGVGGVGLSIMMLIEKELFNIMAFIMSLGLAGLGYLCFKKGKAIKGKTSDIEQDVEDLIISVKHVVGLPIQEGAECSLRTTEENIIINSGNTKFSLDIDKITDITTTTDTEIQKQYVSSTGGAIGGYMLFGPLGGIVGGRAKKKSIKTTIYYLIITYLDDNEIKYISFEHTPCLDVTRFVNQFDFSEQDQLSIEL